MNRKYYLWIHSGEIPEPKDTLKDLEEIERQIRQIKTKISASLNKNQQPSQNEKQQWILL